MDLGNVGLMALRQMSLRCQGLLSFYGLWLLQTNELFDCNGRHNLSNTVCDLGHRFITIPLLY